MELMTRREAWNITYRHALGETASWFFAQIRDNKKIYGRRCATSGRVLTPPRAFSDQSMAPTTEWVEVGPGGVIEAFTIVYEEFQNLPPPPYAFGYVRLDQSDTAIGGFFRGVDLADAAKAADRLKIGARIQTKFAEQRIGDVLDFWFELAEASN
jgi:uncharacterized OB-fold protein